MLREWDEPVDDEPSDMACLLELFLEKPDFEAWPLKFFERGSALLISVRKDGREPNIVVKQSVAFMKACAIASGGIDPVSRPFVHDFTRRCLLARVASVRWASEAGLKGEHWQPGDTSPEEQALLLKAAVKYLGTKADHPFLVELKAQCAAAAARATLEADAAAAAAAAATGAGAGTTAAAATGADAGADAGTAAAATGATTDQAAASSANPKAAAPSAPPPASPLAEVGDTVVVSVVKFKKDYDQCKACTVC